MTTKARKEESFRFKQFELRHDRCAMRIGTDGILLGAWASVDGARKILDIGTGCGVIAIMLAQRTKDCAIHAVEVDKDSYEEARENMERCRWTNRLTAIHTSIQDYSRFNEEKYDLIVSNPPFFTGGTFSANNDRSAVRHAVKLPHGDLLAAVRTLLTDGGHFATILPLIEGLRLKELAESYHLCCTQLTEVRPKRQGKVERLLMQFEKDKKACQKKELIIQEDQHNQWTEEYIRLTGAFYLDM